MNVQAYRDKFSKYIERAVKSQVEDLAKDWQTEKLADLYQALSDYMDIQTDPVGMLAKPSELPKIKKTTLKESQTLRLAHGQKAKIISKILDTFQTQTGTNKTKFSFKASDYGMSRDEFVRKIGRPLNTNAEKQKRFPDLRIKCVKTNDGAMFYLSRKDSNGLHAWGNAISERMM